MLQFALGFLGSVLATSLEIVSQEQLLLVHRQLVILIFENITSEGLTGSVAGRATNGQGYSLSPFVEGSLVESDARCCNNAPTNSVAFLISSRATDGTQL